MDSIVRYARASRAAYAEPAGELASLGLVMLSRMGEWAYSARDADTLVISFRGTDGAVDAIVDAEVDVDDFTSIRLPGPMSVHRGFLGRWMMLRDWAHAQRIGLAGIQRMVICGHSLGGAVATLAAVDLTGNVPIDVYTYGSPRVGWLSFARAYDAVDGLATVRVVHDEDLVPRLPAWPYDHVNGLLHLDDAGAKIGTVRSWGRDLLAFGRRLASDVDGEGFGDHHVDAYVRVCELYAARMAAKATAKTA